MFPNSIFPSCIVHKISHQSFPLPSGPLRFISFLKITFFSLTFMEQQRSSGSFPTPKSYCVFIHPFSVSLPQEKIFLFNSEMNPLPCGPNCEGVLRSNKCRHEGQLFFFFFFFFLLLGTLRWVWFHPAHRKGIRSVKMFLNIKYLRNKFNTLL